MKENTIRIVGGAARGRKLTVPEGMDTRPTMDRVRESVFNILQRRTPGAAVLDLFAGSGAMGLEALSRGAASAALADCSDAAVRCVRQNAEKLGFLPQCRILRADWRAALASLQGSRFGLVFLDPPYRMTDLREVTAALRPLLAPDSLVVIEHKAGEMPAVGDGFEAADQRRYGAAGILMLTPREVETA